MQEVAGKEVSQTATPPASYMWQHRLNSLLFPDCIDAREFFFFFNIQKQTDGLQAPASKKSKLSAM